MIKNEVIILNRDDKVFHNKNKEFDKIEYYDFKISREIFSKASIILFIDNNGRTKILKNRYGL